MEVKGDLIARYLADKPDDFAVAFDANSGCFSTETGERLFDETGKATDFLDKEMDDLRRSHHEHLRTPKFVQMLADEELLSGIQIDVVAPAMMPNRRSVTCSRSMRKSSRACPRRSRRAF